MTSRSRKRRGRKPKLDAEQCESARWYYHNTTLSIAAVAERFDISATSMAKVIDRTYTPRDSEPMSEKEIEQAIQDKGLTAPRVTPGQIDKLMERVEYRSQSPIGTSTFVHAFLDGKFLLATGHSACVDPRNFNEEIGLRIATDEAKAKAREKLWELEGYLLYRSQEAFVKLTDAVSMDLSREHGA